MINNLKKGATAAAPFVIRNSIRFPCLQHHQQRVNDCRNEKQKNQDDVYQKRFARPRLERNGYGWQEYCEQNQYEFIIHSFYSGDWFGGTLLPCEYVSTK